MGRSIARYLKGILLCGSLGACLAFLGGCGGPREEAEAPPPPRATDTAVADTAAADTTPAPAASNPTAPGEPAAGAEDVDKMGFIPSGFMGDGENGKTFVNVDPRSKDQAHRGSFCQKWTYKPGSKGWAAVAWQFPENNWGDKPGKNLSQKNFKKVTFWARGLPDKDGHQPSVQFKAGGNSDPTKPHQASFEVDGDFESLPATWKQFTLKLPDAKEQTEVLSAFTWVAKQTDNSNGATFYLSEIRYQ